MWNYGLPLIGRIFQLANLIVGRALMQALSLLRGGRK